MELRQLQYFCEICHTGSFTKAAANLFVAQPVITNAIHKLEDELEIRLLNRTNKTVTLTAEGRRMLERTEILLGFTNDIYREMTDFNQLSRGSIRLGIPAQIGNYLFPRIFGEFGTRYPKLDLFAAEVVSGQIITMLEKDELDVGIIVLPDSLPNMEKQLLFKQNILLCLSKTHPLCQQKEVSFSDLKNEKFIMRMPGSQQREIIFQECQKCGFIPNVIFSSSQVQTIKTLVARNIGISFLMEISLLDETSIYTIPMAEPISLNIGLVWKKERYISRATQAFMDYMISSFNR
jgi:Transcriptional regulator